MPWTSVYDFRGIEGAVTSVLAIVVRDFKLALDVRYPVEALLPSTDPLFLDDFAERSLGQVIGDQSPMLAIAPIRAAKSPSEDGSHVIEAIRIDLAIGVTDDSAANVTQRIERYSETMEAVLHSANKSDFFANMSSPFGLVVETESIYRPLRGNDSIYFRDSTVELTIQIRER